MSEMGGRLGPSLRADCLAWVALHHLLPTAGFRELMTGLVEIASAGKLKLEDLFEERLIEATDNLSSWAIKPLSLDDPTAEYLQRRIRHLVWQHDDEVRPQAEAIGFDRDVNARSIEDALRLGRTDLTVASATLNKVTFGEGTSIAALLEVVLNFSEAVAAEEFAGRFARARLRLEKVELPLRAVMTKHLGDLCADSDLWNFALQLYDHTITLLDESAEATSHSEFTQMLEAVTIQSKASALRMAEGPSAAASYLSLVLQKYGLRGAPVLALNAGHDAAVVESLSREPLTFARDQRATILFPLQLLESLNDSSAMNSWAEGNYDDASTRFWALLRRQIALGAASETRVTKANFARNVFAELNSHRERHRIPSFFWMATRLLIESGQSEFVKKLDWTAGLIESYVDVPLIERALAHCARNKGAILEHNNVVTELFAAWAAKLPHGRSDIATVLLTFLALRARNGQVNLYAPLNTAGRAMELLTDLAQKRPEFRSHVAPEVVEALSTRIQARGFWRGAADALKLAQTYFPVLSSEQADLIVRAVLDWLATLDPKKAAWVLVQPAMDLLISDEMPKVSMRNPDLGREMVATILRFGIGQQSEHGRLLFYLQDFDLRSISDPKFTDDLQGVLDDVIAQASNYSTAAIYNVCALLYGSKISGERGVTAALASLKDILTAPDRDGPSTTLPEAYQVLRMLSTRHAQIVSDAKLDETIFTGQLQDIFNMVVAVWRRAAKRPVILASFSLPPPTKPSSTIIHNWAYASVDFGLSIGKRSEILDELADAEKHPDLKDAISFGRSARLGGAQIDVVTKEALARESRDAFYAALGNRLLQVRALGGSTGSALLEMLIDKCFKVGPNGLDCGVFLLARGIDPLAITKNPEFINYRTRLEQSRDRDLRFSLFPMLLGLTKGES